MRPIAIEDKCVGLEYGIAEAARKCDEYQVIQKEVTYIADLPKTISQGPAYLGNPYRHDLVGKHATYALTAGQTVYGVELLAVATPGPVTVGIMVDDKKKRQETDAGCIDDDNTVSHGSLHVGSHSPLRVNPRDSSIRDSEQEQEDSAAADQPFPIIHPIPTCWQCKSTHKNEIEAAGTSQPFPIIHPIPTGPSRTQELRADVAESSTASVATASIVAATEKAGSGLTEATGTSSEPMIQIELVDGSMTYTGMAHRPSANGEETQTIQVTVQGMNPTNLGKVEPTSSVMTRRAPDNPGPGLHNIPLKKVKGTTTDGKAVTYPNKLGHPDCKKAKHCIAIDERVNGTMGCLQYLAEGIRHKAETDPEATYSALDPVVCGPSDESGYCAYVQYVPFVPNSGKYTDEFQKMDTFQYRAMTYNKVPIGAIYQGIQWLMDSGAKLCGNALLPVPHDFGVMDGSVYILTVDVDFGLDSGDEWDNGKDE
ncbi:hypothetical protein M8818_007253 [Zalaria obscura]|uniref:Uncharacterized protein n=1 Tax=Zalaria obscura TaxID=2024903 RepID=A0ACC3S521_9PEZI